MSGFFLFTERDCAVNWFKRLVVLEFNYCRNARLLQVKFVVLLESSVAQMGGNAQRLH